MRSHDRPTPLLGGFSPRRFLAQHWQKRPRLIRAAIEGFEGLLSAQQLMQLACREEVESRVVIRRGARWEVHNGPFVRSFFKRLPARAWTLLVQDVNHFLPEARALLSRFRFVPDARLDDLMISYARPGGGVGPHADSYDVFLLQGHGQRRWCISGQRDLQLLPDMPLKLLANFRSEREWVLDPGDMLYLPPGLAHNGIAVGECMTYSVGFRAPSWQELAVEFLSHLQDTLQLPGIYTDPHLLPVTHPALLGSELVERTATQLAQIRWSRRNVVNFLGCYFTEPKRHVFFQSPRRALSLHAFRRRAISEGVTLDLKTRMLYAQGQVFINGEREPLRGQEARRLRTLADQSWLRLSPREPDGLVDRLYGWYRAGFLQIGHAGERC